MCLTNRKTYDDVNWMFEYEGTSPLAVVAIVYSQIARWRKFAKEHFYKGDDSGRSQLMAESIMQFMPRDGKKGLRERTRAGTVLLVPKKSPKNNHHTVYLI